MSAPLWMNFIFGNASILTGIVTTYTKLKDFITVNKQNDTMNEILFYGSDDNEQKKEVGLNNLFCIYYVLVHASQSIDLCVPTLDRETITKCLINVHQKNNAKIRIIVHRSENLKYFEAFLEYEIEIKLINPEVMLEHEYLLIDVGCNDAVAILGSLDYEVNRVNCNRDTTIITSEASLISHLKREFERIWDSINSEKMCKVDRKVDS